MESVNPYQSPAASPLAVEQAADLERPVPTFCSARPWGVGACLGIWLQLMVAVAAIGIQLALLALYNVESVEEIDPVIEQRVLNWMNINWISMVVLRILTAVPFLAWTYRAYVNLLALGHPSVEWKPFMAPVCWLIPVFNLIAPCLVMRELRWRSDPQAETIGKSNPALQYVNLWWGAWILASLMTMIGNSLTTSASALGDHVQALRMNMAAEAVLIVCGGLAIWIVLSIDRCQLRRYDLQTAQLP